MFGKKLKSASTLMKPIMKTIKNLEDNQVARGAKIAVINSQVASLENEKRAHEAEIKEAQGYINGFRSTFNLETK